LIDKDLPSHSYSLLAQKYGDIYQLNLLGNTIVVVNSQALVNELSDESRFQKAINPPLRQVRNLVSDGLFTAQADVEPNWGIAHRLLMPAFGPAAIRGMFDQMRDICDQLLLKWERFGPETVINSTDDFTRVALDTLAYCTMSYRLNSFYTDTSPPFVKAMVDFLKECFARSNRPSVVMALKHGASAKYEEDIKTMKALADRIVSDRRAHPADRKDLLNTMLTGKDPKTGQGLTDDNITRNLLTFLIAGHETSSGTLAFIIYYLLKHPDAMRKLRSEIDEIVGSRPVQYEDLGQMKYLTAVMRETLRLSPTAPTRSVTPLKDTTLGGGKYTVKAGHTIIIQTFTMQVDPLVWGDDATEFRPERMLDGKFEALPPNAWQPFGYGMRACIGRAFAWQEIQLVITSVLQKFDLSLVDPSYTLEIQQSLTIKPKGLHIRATPRTTVPRLHAPPSSSIKQTTVSEMSSSESAPVVGAQPIYVLYGSNTGTSESFAQRIANDAPTHGFRATLGTLDSTVGHLPRDGPVVIVTASFEGEPADNAAHFVEWLKSLKESELAGVRYGIFGCGNHDWVQTYQRIPKLCDELLEQHGAQSLVPRGMGDAGQGNFFQVFDEFETNLWETLTKEYQTSGSSGSAPEFEVKVIDPGIERAATLRQTDAALGRVVENRLLTKPGVPMKRHIEFELPEGAVSRVGDYLAILPHNPSRDIHRVLAHFSLSEEQQVILSSAGPTSLPVGKPITVSSLIGGYVELSQPATPRDLRMLAEASTSDATRTALQGLIDGYPEKVLASRLSVFDVLTKFSDIKISFSKFILMLPPMRIRQYSISSSPLWNPRRVTLTISVVNAPAISGNEEPFLGVASNYLANLRPGDRVQMAVRSSSVLFHTPADPTVPVVMFCAGSGLAPMRGFIQERAAQKESGRDVTKMLLFFGCRSPEEDYLYSDSDLAEWIKLGVVDVRPAFSKSLQDSEGCKHVQDRIWHDRADIIKASRENAKFFTCGTGAIATGIRNELIRIIKTEKGINDAEAVERFKSISADRYAADVFD
jgi:cytochrome P450/NADPH-cytochrome P450 reductase